MSFEIVHYGIVARAEPAPPPDEPRLLCIGRLIPIKGHVVLLRAFAAARAEVPRLDARDRRARPARAGAAGRSRRSSASRTRVRFRGLRLADRRRDRAGAVVVVPSLGEGFGMVALEAMERARPVVAAEIGGLGELVVDGETGLLVPSGEARAAAPRARRARARPERRRAMGEAGRRRALEQFAEQRNVDRTELLYREFLNGRLPQS